ncbi:MAG: hypothetical protein LBE91_08225 [Tannerella sp.]|jgi:hypothetical protein|nr:hypothetical protein [Tannerella sp.]
MKVNFNNLRLQTAYALDNVIKTLNAGIMPESHSILDDNRDERGRDIWYRGDILVEREDLEKDMTDLRHCVYTLICCYEEGNPDYKMLDDELEQNGGLTWFNRK